MPGGRALVVGGSAVMAGGEVGLLRVLERLPAEGWECQTALVVPEPGAMAGALASVGLMPKVFTVARARQVVAGARAVLGLARLARNADVLHANDIRAALYCEPAAMLARRPWVFHARDLYGDASTFGRALRRLHPTRVAAVSRATASSVTEMLGWREDRVDIVYAGLDVVAFSARADRSAWRAEFGLAADEVAVGIVGRLVTSKGQDDFVRAAAAVARDCPQARFFVVGGELTDDGTRWRVGDEVHRLSALAASLDVAERITFTGPRSDVASVMAGLDVVVVASWAEPFGLVLLEAMSLGTTVIATDGGGAPEIIVDGESGVLVPPRSPDRLAAVMAAVVADRARRRGLGEGGRRRVETAFRPEAEAASLAATWVRAGLR